VIAVLYYNCRAVAIRYKISFIEEKRNEVCQQGLILPTYILLEIHDQQKAAPGCNWLSGK
jgi:hypothetical protein